ncbi:hypothetical protein [Falsiroseomonas oryzae]|uniref:hypothetical protein n=1 Tax=Falsiroseomonas oryzae TaxID=2766473 RepID=UPI0022EA3BA5|nr:hypothetical protein [Roseomonas sp. MO-31]
MRIKVMADDGSHGLWWDRESGRIGNIDPADLGLAPGRAAAPGAWTARLDASLNQEDPAERCPPSAEEAAAFRAEGEALVSRDSGAGQPGAGRASP